MKQVRNSGVRMLLAVIQLAMLSVRAGAAVKMPYVITESGLKLYSIAVDNSTQATTAKPVSQRNNVPWLPRPWTNKHIPVQIDYNKYSTEVQGRIKEDLTSFNNQSCVKIKEVNCSLEQQNPCIRICPTAPQNLATIKQVTEPGMPPSAGTWYYIIQNIDIKTNGFLRHAAALAGLPNEHNRADRDEFLVLNTTDNSDLTIFAKDEESFLRETQYDFHSATHIPCDIAKNMSQVTMSLVKAEWTTLFGDSVPLTIARRLSAKDMSRIDSIHNCTVYTSPPTTVYSTVVGGVQSSTGRTVNGSGGSAFTTRRVPKFTVYVMRTKNNDSFSRPPISSGSTVGFDPLRLSAFVALWTAWCLRSALNNHH